jgi:hypothetical protein
MVSAVFVTLGLLGVSSADAAHLGTCRSFTEQGGIYTVMIQVRDVSCSAGRGEYEALIRAERAGRINVDDPRIEPRPHGFYGRFGRRFKLGNFTCRLAAEGLAGSEFTLRCYAPRGREMLANRAQRLVLQPGPAQDPPLRGQLG